MKPEQKARFNFLDSARAILMLLGVPYHAAFFYTYNRTWLVDSPETSLFLSGLVAGLHSFRMQAFFIVAGFFGALILMRRPRGEWLRSRTIRLGLPTIMAFILFGPIQIAAVIAANQGGFDLDAMLPELQKSFSPPGGTELIHLWFLPSLLVMCVFLYFVWPFMERNAEAVTAAIDRAVPSRVLQAVIVVVALSVWQFGVAGVFSLGGIWDFFVGWIPDPFRTLMYFTFFMLGVWLCLNRDWFDRFCTWNTWVFLAGCGAVAIVIYAHIAQPSARSVLLALFEPVAGALISSSVFALLRRFLDNPSKLIKRIVDYAFSIYLIHMPVILVIGGLLLPYHWAPELEWLLITTVAMAVSVLGAALISAVPLLAFLFNGIPMRRTRERGVLSPSKGESSEQAAKAT